MEVLTHSLMGWVGVLARVVFVSFHQNSIVLKEFTSMRYVMVVLGAQE